MSEERPGTSRGTYADKQLGSRFSLMSWSHRARFEKALELTAAQAGTPFLDYGCGDGTLLTLVRPRVPLAVGLEVDAALVADCRARLGGDPQLRFLHVSEAATLADGSFGAVVCTEVLEHCLPEAVDSVLAELKRLVARTGVVVISVPIETGLPLVVKQAARAVAARFVHAHYAQRERYSAGEMMRMLTAGDAPPIPRPVYETAFADGHPNRYHGHKGFNWRVLRGRIERDFTLETHFSPLGALGPQVNSQAWFTCRPR